MISSHYTVTACFAVMSTGWLPVEFFVEAEKMDWFFKKCLLLTSTQAFFITLFGIPANPEGFKNLSFPKIFLSFLKA